MINNSEGLKDALLLKSLRMSAIFKLNGKRDLMVSERINEWRRNH